MMFRRRRIAIVAPSLVGGGAERTMLHLASGLHERGHDVDFLLRELVCDYPGEVSAGIRMFFLTRHRNAEYQNGLKRLPAAPLSLARDSSLRHRFPRLALFRVLRPTQWPLLTSTRLPRWAAAIATYLERECPDTLIASQVPAVAAGMMAVRLARQNTRMIAVLHGLLTTERDKRRARCSFPYADVSVGVSRGLADQVAGLEGISVDRVRAIYNPVVAGNLALKAREPANHPWLDEPGPPVVLAVGRLTPVKDFPCLIDAFAQVLARRRARLIILGKGKQRETLVSQTRRLGIADYVDLPGFAPNPFAFMAKASLFVLSSKHEGLSGVLIQAMACGCPVVSTDCPFGPGEILADGKWGSLAPVGDATALANAMVHTLDNPPRSDELRGQAAKYSVSRAVDRYEALLSD